jgi:hypothetical protein
VLILEPNSDKSKRRLILLRKSVVSVALCGLVFTALASGVSRLRDVSPAVALVTSTGDCDSEEPCVRVYKTDKDVESQSYKVVKFSEVEIIQGAENPRRIHNKIESETGFNCKKAEYRHPVFNCEEGALYATHRLLIEALQANYGG